MFAKSLPVQLLSLQIKRQLHEAVSSVQRELRECCLEPLPNLGLGSWSVCEAADLLPYCHEDTRGDTQHQLFCQPRASLPSAGVQQEETPGDIPETPVWHQYQSPT